MARSALERRESRGGHFRDDHPEKEAAFSGFNIVLRKGPDGAMQLRREPIPEIPEELRRIIEENA